MELNIMVEKKIMAGYNDPVDGRPEEVLKAQALERAIRELREAYSMVNYGPAGDFSGEIHAAKLRRFEDNLKIVNELWLEVLDAGKGYSTKFRNAARPKSDRLNEAEAETAKKIFNGAYSAVDLAEAKRRTDEIIFSKRGR
jgi:hypothetical protein